MRLFQHKTCQTFVLGLFRCSGDVSEFSSICARQTQQESQFSKTKKLQCCSDCSRKLSWRQSNCDLCNRSDSQKSQCWTFEMMHCTVFNTTCSCTTSATRVGIVQDVSFLAPIPIKWCSHKQDLRKSVSKKESHSSSKRWELQTCGTAFLFFCPKHKNYFIFLPTLLIMETNTPYAHSRW